MVEIPSLLLEKGDALVIFTLTGTQQQQKKKEWKQVEIF